jgi:CDGSH-type Zn-finger protein
VVDKCPVDALTWKWNNETKNNEIGVEHPNHINNRRRSIIREEINESDASANIKVIENGPLIINGKFFIERENGTKSKFNGTVSICRCGRSKLPPFCDGSHRNL